MELIQPDWPAPPNVRAAMTTRGGGVSTGPYASLNLGAGEDDPGRVGENRRRLREALALPAEPFWLRQVHGATVVDAAHRRPSSPRGDDRGGAGNTVLPEADASFARGPGAVCVAQAADCLPVLFCDDAGGVVAAAHAGWRGLAGGVLEATVRALPARPGSLMAWLGAAIGPESFEVGPEVREAFVGADPGAAACFRPRPRGGEPPGGGASPAAAGETPAASRFLADLYALARRRLAAAGVTRVSGGGLDTFADRARFFSYRRDGRCGRMAAVVWLSG